MSRKAFLLGFLCCAGLAGHLAAVASGPFFAEDPPTIAGQPYSAVSQTQSTTVFSDGNRIVRTHSVRFYRDSQGRTRVERGPAAVDGSGTQTNVIVITDPAKSERYVLYPRRKIAFALKMQPGTQPPEQPMGDEAAELDTTAPFALLGLRMGVGASAKTEASAATTSLGQQTVNGLSATGTRVVRTIPVGVLGNAKPITSTLEQWLSTDLEVAVRITETSSIGGTITYNLEQVSRAQPAADLFTVPPGYTLHNVNPAAVAAAVAATVEKKP
jgi:hypothetical protein